MRFPLFSEPIRRLQSRAARLSGQRFQRGAIHGISPVALSLIPFVLRPLRPTPNRSLGVVTAKGHTEIGPERKERLLLRRDPLGVALIQHCEELADARSPDR